MAISQSGRAHVQSVAHITEYPPHETYVKRNRCTRRAESACSMKYMCASYCTATQRRNRLRVTGRSHAGGLDNGYMPSRFILDTDTRVGRRVRVPRRSFSGCAIQLRRIAERPFDADAESSRQEIVSLCVEARDLYERYRIHRHRLCGQSTSVQLLVEGNQPANPKRPLDAAVLRSVHFAAWLRLAIDLASQHTDLLPGGVLIGGAEHQHELEDGTASGDGSADPIDWIDGVKYPLVRWRQMAREFADVCDFLETCAIQLTVGSRDSVTSVQQSNAHFLRPKDIRLYIHVDGTTLFKRAERGDIRRQLSRTSTTTRPVWLYSLVDVFNVWGDEPVRTSGTQSPPWSLNASGASR
jgi:hypothetical protein